MTLAIMNAGLRLAGFTLHSGSIYKKTIEALVIAEVSVDGTPLELKPLDEMTEGSYHFDVATKTLYVWLEANAHPHAHFVGMVQKLFFASGPVSLPYDLDNGDEVFFEPLVKSTSSFGVEIDTVNQASEAIEGKGSLSLINDFEFWPKNFDKLTFDNQKVEIYSYDGDHPKLLFRGIVESKSYGPEIKFTLKDLMNTLRNAVSLETIGSLNLKNEASLENAYQRMVFGRVSGFKPTNVDALVEGSYPITGTLTVTQASASVTGSGTLFLSELSPDDVLILEGVSYTVASIASNTSLTLTETYQAISGSITAKVKPDAPKRFINRVWKLAGHALNQPLRTIQAGSTTNRLFLDSTSDIKDDDEIYVGVLGSGELVTVDKVINSTQLTLKNSLAGNPSAGTSVLRPCIQQLKIDETELRFYRDYTVDASTATLTLLVDAEKNASQVKESTQSATFTNGSRTVTGSGTFFKMQ